MAQTPLPRYRTVELQVSQGPDGMDSLIATWVERGWRLHSVVAPSHRTYLWLVFERRD